MTDILKEKIIIRSIKVYKNREEWADEYVQENYQDAIEYMKEYFDKLFPTATGSGAGSTTPDGAKIKKIQQYQTHSKRNTKKAPLNKTGVRRYGMEEITTGKQSLK